jgi:hypothetical protein
MMSEQEAEAEAEAGGKKRLWMAQESAFKLSSLSSMATRIREDEEGTRLGGSRSCSVLGSG